MMLVAWAYATSAQFTLLPQIGIENPVTKISYNNLPSFDPLTTQQLNLNLRADYKFKGGFGPYISIGTNRSGVNYSFADPETGMKSYTAKAGNMQLLLNAGIQYSSPSIPLGKQQSSGKQKMTGKNTGKNCCSHSEKTVTKCGSKISYSRCGSKAKSNYSRSGKPQNWTMRLQPSVGFGYIPADKPVVEMKSGSYTYNAGQMKTSITSGMGFEFAKGKAKLFTLRVNYFKGLGNDEKILTTSSGIKTVTTTLNSKVSGWSTTIGIPISFTKNPAARSQHQKNTDCQRKIIYRCSERKTYRF
jgi:hypothetical protein